MQRTALYKLLILVATGATCGGVVWWKLCVDSSAPSNDGSAGDGAATVGVGDGALLDPAAIEGTVLDEAAAKALFRGVREGTRQIYDPIAYAVLKPDVTQTWPWPEHADGRIVSRTNNLGFREDADTQEAKAGPRVLVAGDSHTDGMVNNDESFANVLEAHLNAALADGARRVEVLNAGVGNTGPHNYVGTLERNLHLQPDVFIAVLYTGNDFLNALELSDFFTKRPESKPTGADGEAYQRLMVEAYRKFGALVVDRFNQPLKFTRFPADAEIGLQASVDCFLQMSRICAEHHIAFLAVILPTKPDVDLHDDRQTFADALSTCGLTEEQYGIDARLGARFADALRAHGVALLDCTDALRAAADTPHYWRKDWHLNVAGHALVAGLLQDAVAPLLPRDG